MIVPGGRNRPARKIVGCTMAGPAFMDLAIQARESFECVTGLPCVLVRTPEDKNYRSKFDLHHQFDDDQTVIFFDADTRWVKPFDHLTLTRDFGMVPDPGRYNPAAFPMGDCARLGMNPDVYGNSGVMVFGAEHRPLWALCNSLWGKVKVDDFGEQTIINLAIQKLGVKRAVLSDDWNFAPVCIHSEWPQFYSPIPYVVHAMGYKHQQRGKRLTDKEAVLNHWESSFILQQP